MGNFIQTKRARIIAAAAVLLLIILFLARDQEPGFLEVERLKALERHSSISERAHELFDQRYQHLAPESKRPEAIAQALGLQPLDLMNRSDGGREARVEMAGKYSQLILRWDASGEPAGFGWEVDTPAADNDSWTQHLETFAVAE